MKRTILMTLTLLIAGMAVAPAQAGLIDTLKKYAKPAAKFTAAGVLGTTAVLLGLGTRNDYKTMLKATQEINAIAANRPTQEEALIAYVLLLMIRNQKIPEISLMAVFTLGLAGLATWTLVDGIGDIIKINAEDNQ